MPKGVREPLEKRIKNFVEIDNVTDCWHFMGAKNNIGYGMIKKSRSEGMGTTHKIMYELYNYCIVPDDLVVYHTCDSYDCCNPAHLDIGSRKDVWNLMKQRGTAKPFGGKQAIRYSCVHCGLTSTAGMIARWHNYKCKNKPSA